MEMNRLQLFTYSFIHLFLLPFSLIKYLGAGYVETSEDIARLRKNLFQLDKG
jgi:cell division protein FtsB